MRTVFGVPVVEHMDDLAPTVERLGIRPWTKRGSPVDLDVYRFGLADSDPLYVNSLREEVRRFAPKSEVLFLRSPGGTEAEEGRYFRSVGKNWVAVFAPFMDPSLPLETREQPWNFLVPIVAEWKHGVEVTVIGPVYGQMNEGESPRDCALREFREETGFELADVQPLTRDGLAVSPRQSTQQYFPFLGRLQEPIARHDVHLDKTEHLRLVFVTLWAWLNFIVDGRARDDNAYATTFLALSRMNLLRFSP
ncbi:MAG: NUDIX domain-containing protein [Patescibacteria group bacterium]